ncbi:TonB-dependent receptor [Caulobacter segnis]|uniref:TonB-dependent receptor n=2 Tax=Caulobacter segnis TaxID=88688 RepID=D5VG86_CAUST|nr:MULTISPECIES: TonB-dependent receptor [Caulobacter]ADG10205.1 TonB-dependent receptor [Caulobacter segnis ATCC 21756]AVQ01950.1 TonB-dependent receptor [Caulobacter segnis]SFJ31676.1 iron complex outermembrane recepter protein [Caulobacter sp. UNC279MFTsu5.1]
MKYQKTLLTAGLALAACSSAMAETAAPAAETASAQAPSSNVVADIIVTAERRDSTVQKTGATISVLGGDELVKRGVGSLNDALSNVPGVYLQVNNKGANVDIRGVGTGLDSAAGDPGVNTNIDGVYLRQASTIVSGLYDVARVEVLKGPQGTLYGRNATGGVVNILTNDPGYEFGYSGSLTVGNYNLIRSEGAFNIPVSSQLALRAAFGSESHDGYLDTGQDDAKRFAGRLKLLWEPTSTFDVLAGVSYAHEGGVGPGSVLATEPEGSRHAVVSHQPAGTLDQDFVTVFGKAEWDAGPIRVTFLPTFSRYVYDYTGTNYSIYSQQRARENQTTTELRFSSSRDAKVQWVSGLYYFHGDLSNYANLPDYGVINDQPNLVTKSYAVFGDITVPLSDRLRLGGGLRYTADRKSQIGTLVSGGGVTVGPFDGKLRSNAVNYRIGVQYDLAQDVMLYATHATGYKAGGFLPDQPGYDTYKPEKLRSVEAGIKSRLFDGRLQLNLSGFHYSYDNYQTSTLGLAHYGGLSALVFNSQGTTKIYGAELQAIYRPTERDQFELTLSPMKSKFGAFVIPATPASAMIDVSGKQLPHAPSLSGMAAYQHEWRLQAGSLTGRIQTNYSSKYFTEFTQAAYSQRPSYTRTDLNLTYSADESRWSVGLFVRNLEDAWIVSLKANTAVGDYGLQPPRTFGLTLNVKG